MREMQDELIFFPPTNELFSTRRSISNSHRKIQSYPGDLCSLKPAKRIDIDMSAVNN